MKNIIAVCAVVFSVTLMPVAAIPASTAIVSAITPSSRSAQVGEPVTVFTTIINTGSVVAVNCSVSLGTDIPVEFIYQTTDPFTNALTGTPNTSVNIAAGGLQTFVLAITPEAEFGPADVILDYVCENTDYAPSVQGLNTWLVSGSYEPVPDVIAAIATVSQDGILDLPDDGSITVFGAVGMNIGAPSNLTVSLEPGINSLPITYAMCLFDLVTEECITEPGLTAEVYTDENTIGAFIIAAQPGAYIPFDPANSRVFVTFRDPQGVIRGAASVAVRTYTP